MLWWKVYLESLCWELILVLAKICQANQKVGAGLNVVMDSRVTVVVHVIGLDLFTSKC